MKDKAKKRKEEIEALVPENSKILMSDTIEEVVFLEDKLEELRKHPFIAINPKNKAQQKSTPAAKMYKEFLQQYINCIKMLEDVIYKEKRLEGANTIEESPLRKWFREHADKT